MKAINPRNTPSTRDYLWNKLIPAWYKVGKLNVVAELRDIDSVALTCDSWSSIVQDHTSQPSNLAI